MTGERVKIAIVGGGMAGLYAHWRLLEAGHTAADIRQFEATERLGGRVKTVVHPDAPELALDLGAHTLRDDHALARALAGRLALRVEPYSAREPGAMLHMRGRTLTSTAVGRALVRRPFSYQVSAAGQRRGTGRMLRHIARRFAAETDAKGHFHGRPLDEWPLSQALRQVLSEEELRYLSDRSGYGLWYAPLQARAVIAWGRDELFMGKHAFVELTAGMAALPQALEAAIRAGGGHIATGHRLAALTIGGESAPFTLIFSGPEGSTSVTAERVVLAMPRGALAAVDGLAERQPVQALLEAVAPWRIVTGAIIYDAAWWTALGFRAGGGVTDLPVRHLRYHGAESWRAVPPKRFAVSLYADAAAADYWRSLGPAGAWLGADHPATLEIHRQLGTMFARRLGYALPAPLDAILQDWGAQPFGGAYHLWAAGSEPARVIRAARQPIDGLALHLCGETWSPRQAWIEGALTTTEAVLTEHFGLAPFPG